MCNLFSVISHFVFLSVVSFAQVVTDCQLEGLKSNVKTIDVEGAMLEGKTGKWKELRRGRAFTTSWDNKGYEIERIIWVDEQPFSKTESTYDAKQMTRTEKYYPLYQNNLTFPRGIPLDSKGNPMKMPSPQPQASVDVFISEILYKFDNAGNRSENLIYEGQGVTKKLSQRRVYIWDTDGKMKEEQWYDSGKLKHKYVYKYDAQGNKIEHFTVEDKGKITSHTIYSDYQFDAQGNWISRIEHQDYLTSFGQRIESTHISYRQITYWQ